MLDKKREQELLSKSRLTQAEVCELLDIHVTSASVLFSKNKDFLRGTYYILNKRRIFRTDKLVEFMDNGGENV